MRIFQGVRRIFWKRRNGEMERVREDGPGDGIVEGVWAESDGKGVDEPTLWRLKCGWAVSGEVGLVKEELGCLFRGGPELLLLFCGTVGVCLFEARDVNRGEGSESRKLYEGGDEGVIDRYGD
ncbi:hypothetical protein Tco_0044758 [Tanacetum coccineum]